MKKRRKAERGRPRKRKEAQPRSGATTPKDKALQGSEAKFRSLVETTAVPIGITDSKGEFAYEHTRCQASSFEALATYWVGENFETNLSGKNA